MSKRDDRAPGRRPAPSGGHRLYRQAEGCPSLPRLVDAAVNDDWSPEEATHVRRCAYCTMSVEMARRVAPGAEADPVVAANATAALNRVLDGLRVSATGAVSADRDGWEVHAEPAEDAVVVRLGYCGMPADEVAGVALVAASVAAGLASLPVVDVIDDEGCARFPALPGPVASLRLIATATHRATDVAAGQVRIDGDTTDPASRIRVEVTAAAISGRPAGADAGPAAGRSAGPVAVAPALLPYELHGVPSDEEGATGHGGAVLAGLRVVVSSEDPDLVGKVVGFGFGAPGVGPTWLLVPLHGVTGGPLGEAGLKTVLGRAADRVGSPALHQTGPVILDAAGLGGWLAAVAASVGAAKFDRDRSAWDAVAADPAVLPIVADGIRTALREARRGPVGGDPGDA